MADLIPFMLRAFLKDDRAFARAHKNGLAEGEDAAAGPSSLRSLRRGTAAGSAPSAPLGRGRQAQTSSRSLSCSWCAARPLTPGGLRRTRVASHRFIYRV
nr:hypothetical protein [Roseospira marina]